LLLGCFGADCFLQVAADFVRFDFEQQNGGNKKPPCGGFSLFFDSAPVQTAAECGSAVLGLCD